MRPKSKTNRLVRLFVNVVTSAMVNANSCMARRSPVFTKWTLVRVLALGVLMSAGAAMYFNLASEGAAVAPTTDQDRQATSIKIAPPYRGVPIDDDEWRCGPPYLEDFPPEAARPLSEEAVAVYQRDDDEWLYSSPYIQVFHDADLEESNQAVTPKSAPSYQQQRVADSLEERMEVQWLLQDITPSG